MRVPKLERSHGKARPRLPRSRDLRPAETAPDPTDGRGTHGQFARGNRISVRAGEKRAAKKLLGKAASEGDAAVVARDAARAFRGAMRELPSDGQLARSLAALYGRHLAASAFYAAKSDEAGPATAEGIRLAELALKHGARAERLAISALDVASTLAKAKPAPAFPWLGAAPAHEPEEASDPGERGEDEGEAEEASTRHVGAAIEVREDDDEPDDEEDAMRDRDNRLSPTAERFDFDRHERDARQAMRIETGPTTKIDLRTGRPIPTGQEPGAAPQVPSARRAARKLTDAELAAIPKPPPPGVPLRFDPTTATLVPVASGRARPTPEAIDAMRDAGLDVSRWEGDR